MIVHEEGVFDVKNAILDAVKKHPSYFQQVTFTFIGIPKNHMEHSGQALLEISPLIKVFPYPLFFFQQFN